MRIHLTDLRAMAGFSIVPLVSVVMPLVLLPVVSVRHGEAGWQTMAIAQSVGAVVGIVTELGWSLTGPQQVARLAGSPELTDFVAVAFWSRWLAFLALAPLTGLAAALIVSQDAAAAAVIAIGTQALALSPAWLLVGLRNPRLLLLLEVLPRAATTLTVAGSIWLGADLWVVGTMGPVSVLASLVLVHRRLAPSVWGSWATYRARALGALRSQWMIVRLRCVSSVYQSAPPALLALVAPAQVAGFAATDRLMRITLAGLQGVPNSQQAAMGSVDAAGVRVTGLRFLRINLVAGLVVGACFAVGGIPATHFIFASTVEPDVAVLLTGSAIILSVSCSRATGLLWLTRLGRIDVISRSTTGAAMSMIVTFPLLAYHWGALGAMLSVLLAELTGLALQLSGLRSARAEKL